MNVLVIGGTRFIGPYAVGRLAAEGHTVTVFHRGQTEADLPASVHHIRDSAAGIPVVTFPAAVFERRWDVVVHMTPMGERDAVAAVSAFRDRTGRFVAISSGDVYLAYGRFMGLEPGPLETGPLTESSPIRSVLYTHRTPAMSPDNWMYWYEKILVERTLAGEPGFQSVVLRLPKVYGPKDNADLSTVHAFRAWPQWRWTHGYVENVAQAIVLAAVHPAAFGIYNVGERRTPSVAERRAHLPPSSVPDTSLTANFAQNIEYDTTRIREHLGYTEAVDYEEGLRRTLASSNAAPSRHL